MARTLEEVDAALVTAEARIQQLITGGQNLRSDVTALQGQIATLQQAGQALRQDVNQLQNAAPQVVQRIVVLEGMVDRAAILVKRIKSEIRFQENLPAPDEQTAPAQTSPRIKHVLSRGKVVARARSSR